MYIPLARKYRPSSFKEVVGQNISKRILMNSIQMNRIASSMLITGIKGTGKTTLARVYAKALNCEQLIDGDVCNTCSSCVDAGRLTHPDILEFDAASNNGVDFIRDLTDNLNQMQTYKRRVFILDEAHMFTPQAQAAFLKALEEPPENTTLILVTTDPQRLTDTVRSRCLSMPLKPLSVVEIEESLRRVLEGESQAYTEDFVKGLALVGSGSLRDVQQCLDQIIVGANGQTLDDSYLEDYLGVVSVGQYKNLAGILCSLDLKYCLESTHSWYKHGADLKQLFIEGVPVFLRDCMIFLNNLTEVPFETGIPVEVFQERLTLDMNYVRYIEKCWEEMEQIMRDTFNPRAVWSMFCVKICPIKGL